MDTPELFLRILEKNGEINKEKEGIFFSFAELHGVFTNKADAIAQLPSAAYGQKKALTKEKISTKQPFLSQSGPARDKVNQ